MRSKRRRERILPLSQPVRLTVGAVCDRPRPIPCVKGGGSPNGGSVGFSLPQSASLTAPSSEGALGAPAPAKQLEFVEVCFLCVQAILMILGM